MSTKEHLPLSAVDSVSLTKLKELIPRGYTQPEFDRGLWTSAEVLNGPEHNPSHPIIVAGLVFNLGRFLNRQYGLELNLQALGTAAVFHDVCRNNDSERDHLHGLRAGSLMENLYAKGELTTDSNNFSEALRIVKNHQKRHLQVSPDDLNLRFFIFCDVLSMVRYEGNGNGFSLTREALEEILPDFFSHGEINYLIAKTREWNDRCQRLVKKGIDPLSAALYSGRKYGFFTDGEQDQFHSIYLIKQKAQRKRPITTSI